MARIVNSLLVVHLW